MKESRKILNMLSNNNNIKRVGVLSGTFDPFHIAHLEACLVAQAACDLDAILVMIEKKPHKKYNVTPYQKRLTMVEYATAEFPKIRLLEAPGPNITIDNTLPLLHHHFSDAEYWFIVGSDVVTHLAHWENPEKLFATMHLCVVLRSNKDKKDTESKLKKLKAQFKDLQYQIVPEVWSEVSSSAIRRQIKGSGYSQNVHRDVLKYILTNNLY